MTGKKATEETKSRIQSALSDRYKIQRPTGEIDITSCPKEYGKEHKILMSNLKTYGHTKGYKLIEVFKKNRVYEFKNVNTGEVVITNNMKKFCEDHSLYTHTKQPSPRLLSTMETTTPFEGWLLVSRTITESCVQVNPETK